MAAKRKTKRAVVKRSTARKATTKKPQTKVRVTRGTTKKSTKRTTKTKTKKVQALKKIRKPYTKSELYTTLCERTGLTKKDIAAVFEGLSEIIESHLQKGGAEEFKLPNILKMKVRKTPAKKARKGINPFTGESMMFKAKPASRKVKITALKNLKEMAA